MVTRVSCRSACRLRRRAARFRFLQSKTIGIAMTIDIRRLRDRLPQEMAGLESEARREGYRHVARLIDEWSAGDISFEHHGERLLGAYVD
ncbi:N-acetyltransferase, partial [Rhizobium ruizarguesonis]